VLALRGAPPAGTNAQMPCEPAVLQDLHVSVQALLQQTPSTQNPLAQSPPQPQAAPLAPVILLVPLQATAGASRPPSRTDPSAPGVVERMPHPVAQRLSQPTATTSPKSRAVRKLSIWTKLKRRSPPCKARPGFRPVKGASRGLTRRHRCTRSGLERRPGRGRPSFSPSGRGELLARSPVPGPGVGLAWARDGGSQRETTGIGPADSTARRADHPSAARCGSHRTSSRGATRLLPAELRPASRAAPRNRGRGLTPSRPDDDHPATRRPHQAQGVLPAESIPSGRRILQRRAPGPPLFAGRALC